MSFVETNKRWLVPVLGVALAGVAWMNRPGAAPAARGPMEAPGADLALPDETSRPAPPEGKPDLSALEALPGTIVDPAPLLLEGRRTLTAELRNPVPPPSLHPDQWARLYQAPLEIPMAQARPQATAPPPTLDFVSETATKREAWMNGRGFRQGDDLGGGYLLKRFTGNGVVLAGPGGELELPLKSAPGHPRSGRGKDGGRP